MYNETVMEHFMRPRNTGEITDADGIGKARNPVCGDVMHIFISVNKNNAGEEIISDIRFQTFGCVAAIATSSMTTELAKKKSLDDALKITRDDVARALGGLPPIKMHCSNLALGALHAAINDYHEKQKQSKGNAQAGTL